MISPAFRENPSSSNIGAMLRRCNILFNAKNAVCFHPAGQDDAVEKFPLYAGYLKPEAGAALWAYLHDTSARRDC
eukprot:4462809-Pyramimonas_sp.AAC.1